MDVILMKMKAMKLPSPKLISTDKGCALNTDSGAFFPWTRSTGSSCRWMIIQKRRRWTKWNRQRNFFQTNKQIHSIWRIFKPVWEDIASSTLPTIDTSTEASESCSKWGIEYQVKDQWDPIIRWMDKRDKSGVDKYLPSVSRYTEIW